MILFLSSEKKKKDFINPILSQLPLNFSFFFI